MGYRRGLYGLGCLDDIYLDIHSYHAIDVGRIVVDGDLDIF